MGRSQRVGPQAPSDVTGVQRALQKLFSNGEMVEAEVEPLARDPALSLLLPLLILLSTLLFLLVFFLIFIIVLKRRRGRGIALTDNDGPIDLAREEELEGEGGLTGIEERWLEQQDEATQAGYERAKSFQQQYRPNSSPSDITLSQFLSIQEKGVSAWSFEPDYETNSPLFVTSRTEITFLEDGIGMAANEGGACCVQSNLPLPRINEVYYWECKLYEKPESTNIAIGLSTKPYPSFRMPGWNRYSIGYFSSDGFKCHNYPFTSQSYGPPLAEGDVLGVGYRPRTGAVFFTRNGRKLDDAYIGLTKHNLFPTVAADGAAIVHVNLGQAGFVFIEANVKKWGLAPMIGTLAPPPAYGSERGSILLETAGGQQAGEGSQTPSNSHQRQRSAEQAAAAALSQPPEHPESGARQRGLLGHRRLPSGSTVPIRPSPLRTSMTRQRTSSYNSSANSASSSPVSIPGAPGRSAQRAASLDENEELDGQGSGDEDDSLPHNPPTPGQLDISLRAMSPFSRRIALEERETRRQNGDSEEDVQTPTSSTPPYHVAAPVPTTRLPGDVSPPSYQLLDANQYPAGVAEAMLEAMPEEQLAALFAGAGSSAASATAAGSSSSSILHAYENSTSSTQEDPPRGDQQGLGLRGFFGSVWGAAGEQNRSNA